LRRERIHRYRRSADRLDSDLRRNRLVRTEAISQYRTGKGTGEAAKLIEIEAARIKQLRARAPV
jgi:hypothetical protein